MKLSSKRRCKKLLSATLAIVMVLGLAACKSNDTPDTETDNPPVIQNPDSTDNSNVNTDVAGTETDNGADTEVDNTGNTETENVDKVVMSSANERLKYILYQARDEETNDYMKSYSDDSAGFLSLLGLSEDDVEECVISTSMMNVKAYMIAIFKPANTGVNDKIISALETYKQSMIDSFKQYLQDQLEIAENASIFTENGYIGIVMCEDADTIRDSIKSALKNIDNIEIDETLPPQVKDKMSMKEIFEIWNSYQDSADPEVETDTITITRSYFTPFKSIEDSDGKLKLDIDFQYTLDVTFGEDGDTPVSMILTDVENTEHTVDLITGSLDDFLNNV